MKENSSIDKQSIPSNFDGVYVLRMSLNGAGFGAVLLQTLNQIRYCERNNLLPVVNYDQSCNSYFFDIAHGENMWDQYFEPLIPSFGFAKVMGLCRDPNHSLTKSDLRNLDDKDMLEICEHDIDSIYTFPFADWRLQPPENLKEWYNEQRRKGRETYSKYIKVKPSILSRIGEFRNNYFDRHQVLGIHMRGTDLSYAPPVSPAEYFPHIDKWVDSHKSPRLFVATDQQQYLAVIRKRYGEMVVSYDSSRSANEIAPFNLKDVSPYKKGEDVLIDMYLLSETDFLVKGTSAVSELALYVNPALGCLDLSFNKRFAFGQDYGEGWNGGILKETKPAWLVVNKTKLTELSSNAKTQTAWQAILYKYRPYYSPLFIFLRRVKIFFLKKVGFSRDPNDQ